MSISAAAAYSAAARLQQQQQPNALGDVANSFPTPAEAAAASTSAAETESSGSKDSGRSSTAAYTPTALSRWSLLNDKLPAANTIRNIHIYDFDNTLFKTPLPNSKLWNAATIGSLSNNDVFISGGWWHDVRILAATGAGREIEEPRAWQGWWNEQVVELVRLSMKQPDALCVLLTGRSERGFGDLVQRMVNSKKLVFDMIALKPAVGPNNERFSSTMQFKQAFLEAVMETYAAATEIRIYEDRPRHVEGFREFLVQYNEKREKRSVGPLPPIAGEVVPVTETATTLDPAIEVAEVQHMINCHNEAGGGKRGMLSLNKTVFFTGYLIKDADTKRLLELLQLPQPLNRRDVKYHANSIMIGPRVCSPFLLAKAGGMGNKMTWRVEAIGSVDNSVWAVKVRPATPGATYHTAEATPLVVLAVYRTARPHEASRIRKWAPVAADKVFDFETTVGEKAILRVESEHTGDAGNQEDQNKPPPIKRHRGSAGARLYNNGAANARPRANPTGSFPTQPAGFVPPRGPSGQFGSQGGSQGYHSQAPGRGGFRGGFHGGRGNFRGGGSAMRGGPRRAGTQGHTDPGVAASKAAGRSTGYYNYQSLDDAGSSSNQAPSSNVPQRQKIVYDDTL
ncbi:uncharacterized protein SPSK_00472 [Sporothrix schenckii 1099-18]|uniref:Swiss Army Knife RNA repair protein HAD domain-containing protein n=1 Tax=Sporothrix schenckii 1099-18 TaxID=1397361 RepID=A0A0F2LT48_SPOSC|nr:uncharacterized protein SPSK_00472 [Sporothrix schenckii 1099-18]KJR80029.1 hypothetical protein SPSK_00472 [Sporothrix schenckii 1099-18]